MLADFNDNFKQEVSSELKGQYPQECDQLRHRVNLLFFAAVIRYVVELNFFSALHHYKDNLLNINPDGTLTDPQPDRLNFQTNTPVNVAVWPLSLWSLNEGVYHYTTPQSEALFIAVGDALVNPHFFTGTGLTLVRGVVDSITAIRQATGFDRTLSFAPPHNALFRITILALVDPRAPPVAHLGGVYLSYHDTSAENEIKTLHNNNPPLTSLPTLPTQFSLPLHIISQSGTCTQRIATPAQARLKEEFRESFKSEFHPFNHSNHSNTMSSRARI